MPETRAFHVVIPDFKHSFRAQRDERQILADIPPAVLGAARSASAGLFLGPVPRMVVERRHQRVKLSAQVATLLSCPSSRYSPSSSEPIASSPLLCGR